MPNYSGKNDETLVELSLLGDDSAYAELVSRHQRAVMGTAYKVTENSFSAEDASQDAFVSAWMNLSSLRYGEKFGSWVCAIAKNSARRLNARYRAAIPSLSFETLRDFELSDVESEQLIGEDYAEVHEAVEALSAKIRETVRLHYFDGRSVSEIAKQLGISVGTVKWRLFEGRKQLRKGYGVMEDDYNKNESLVVRVMRQVDALKMWRFKNDKTGFASEYAEVLRCVEELDDSNEKNSMLADTLLLGYWWLPGERNDETIARIRRTADAGHNDDVMQTISAIDYEKYSGDEKIAFMKGTQIPYYRENNYPKTLANIHFWLGYEYSKRKQHAAAIECFDETMRIAAPSNAYYANAMAAVECERRAEAAEHDETITGCNYEATGEIYRFIGDKLYFSEQPGYSSEAFISACSTLFWNMSACDSVILDLGMSVGDKTISADGTVTYLSNNATCTVPAGRFDGCSVFAWNGERYGQTYAETYLCPGVGIVYQKIMSGGEVYEWELEKYRINGGKGLIPFAAGNRWEYSQPAEDMVYCKEESNIFEVTAFDNNAVTLMHLNFIRLISFRDTWLGRTAEVRSSYVKVGPDGLEHLNDVEAAMKRCEETAKTKRQRIHTSISNAVMRRIFAGDPNFTPDCSRKGRWDFFDLSVIRRSDGMVSFSEYYNYSFEWKDMHDISSEGNKVLYSFMLRILRDATGYLWSDEWVDGYRLAERHDKQYVTRNIEVHDGGTVETPAGRFGSCRHLSFEYDAWGYFSGRSDYWFAEGIGIVKYEHPIGGGSAVWQLTDYTGSGCGWFPTDDGLFRRYEPDTLGDGWEASVEFTFDEDENGTVMFKNALGTQAMENYKKSVGL